MFFAAFAINNLVPLRAGDIYRSVAAARFSHGTIAKSVATLWTERVLDLAALIIVLSVLVLCTRYESIESAALPIASFLMIGVLLLVTLIAFPVMARQLVETVLHHGADRFPTVKVAHWIRNLTGAIEGTLSKNTMLLVVTLTMSAWFLELGVFVLVGSALRGRLLLSGGLGAGVLGTLATLIPGAPGHLGTFDFFAAEGFRRGGLDAESAVAAAVLCHSAVVAPVTIYGSIQLVTNRQANAS